MTRRAKHISEAGDVAVVAAVARVSYAVAADLLERVGGIRGACTASERKVCETPGVGVAGWRALNGARELAARAFFGAWQNEPGEALTSPSLGRAYLKLALGHYEHEVFACVFLTSQHRVLACEEMFHGTIDSADVHPREVVKRALHHNAAAVIFAHNHPSGSSEPSKADENITKELKRALELVDVRVLDHFVVGDTITSLVERRML